MIEQPSLGGVVVSIMSLFCLEVAYTFELVTLATNHQKISFVIIQLSRPGLVLVSSDSIILVELSGVINYLHQASSYSCQPENQDCYMVHC